MKNHSSRLLVVGLGLLAAAVDGADASGFVRICNAVCHGSGPMQVFVDGRPLHQPGYQPGDVTGAVVVPAGPHVVRFMRDGIVSGTTRIVVKDGVVTTLVPFAVPAEPTRGAAEAWKVSVLRLRLADAGEQRVMRLVSVSRQPVVRVDVGRPDGAWHAVELAPAQVASLGIEQARGYIPLRHGGRRVGSVPVGPPGNHVVVIHDDGDGQLACIVFREQRVWLPP